jgi:hypothetical protein
VLADGELVGVWRSRLDGPRVRLTVEPFGRLSRRTREEIETESERVALIRGSEAADVTFT